MFGPSMVAQHKSLGVNGTSKVGHPSNRWGGAFYAEV